MVRDQDNHIYFRENDGCLMLGGFEPVAKPAFEDGLLPGNVLAIFVLFLQCFLCVPF